MELVPEVEGETAQSFSDVPLLSDLYVLGKQKRANNRPNTAIDRCKTYPNKYTLRSTYIRTVVPYGVLWSTAIEIHNLDPARSSLQDMAHSLFPCGEWSHYYKALS